MARVIRRRSQGARRRDGRIDAAAEQRDAEQGGGDGEPEQRRQEVMRLADLGHRGVARRMEGGGREDQDRGVDQQREHQRDGRVDGGELQRFALFRQRFAIGSRLHDARVQVEIMRHHRGAEDAERQVEHFGVGDDLGGRREPADHLAPVRVRQRDLHRKADRDDAEQGDHQRFDPAEAEPLQVDDVGVPLALLAGLLGADQRQRLELLHIGRIDVGLREAVAAALIEIDGPRRRRDVDVRADGEAGAKRLQHDRHDVGDQRDDQQRVAEARAACERGGPVARVHIAHGDQVTRPDKSKGAPPEAARAGDGNAAMHIGERRIAAVAAPAGEHLVRTDIHRPAFRCGRSGSGLDIHNISCEWFLIASNARRLSTASLADCF